MKLIFGLVFSFIALAELVVSQGTTCENLTDLTLINQGYNYIEGDIIIPAENLSDFVMSTDPYSPNNAVARNTESLWDNGIIPYQLSSSLNQRAQNAILNAMDFYKENTCVDFEVRTNQPNYVYFFPGAGCYSYIGNIRRGRQDISIGSGCEYEGIVQHEIFHALGRWHEQSRPDRNSYIRILNNNIISDQISNFERVSSNIADTQNLEYDFSSIMHYGATAFSHNGQRTIETIDSSFQNVIGQRQGLSAIDITHVNLLYSCDGEPSNWSMWSSWSTCPLICREYSRNRTRTCVGTGCTGLTIEYEMCGTNACPTPSFWGLWGSWTQCGVTCNGGRRYRTRVCQNGNDCSGLYYEIDNNCNSNPCVVATWSEWSEYGSCSLTCGGGVMARTRECSLQGQCVGPTTQSIACNVNPCLQDGEIINSSLRALGCFQYLSSSNLFYYSNGSTFTLDTREVSAINRAIVVCSQSAISRNREYFAMIDGYCMQEGNPSDSGIDAFVVEIAPNRCSNRAGSYQNGLAMDLWYIYDPNGITTRVRRDTTFVDGNNTNVEEMDREAELCGINVGGRGSGVGSLTPTMLYALFALLALLVLQY